MFIKCVVLLSSALLASGGLVGLEPIPMLDGRIVGGYEVDISQVPWQVSLQYSGSHLCGGSIISDKWILTAAHCTNGRNAENLKIRIGSSEKSNGGILYKVKRIIQHKQFTMATIDYDFSLIELQETIEFNESVQPIKLVERELKVMDGTVCLVSGWGNTQSADESPEKLRAAEIPIVNQQKCSDAYRGTNSISPRMICAGLLDVGGKDSCQGDSGGPLVIFDDVSESPILAGIVSWGYGCAQPGYPGVYSRITSAHDWITENSGI